MLGFAKALQQETRGYIAEVEAERPLLRSSWDIAQERALERQREVCAELGDMPVDVYHGTAGRFAESIREQGLITKNWHDTVCVTHNLELALGYASIWAAQFTEKGDEPEGLIARVSVPAKLLEPYAPHQWDYERQERSRLGKAAAPIADCYMLPAVPPPLITGLAAFPLEPLSDEATRRTILLPHCIYASQLARDRGLVDLKSEATCSRCGLSWVFDECLGWAKDGGEWSCAACMTDEEFADCGAWLREYEDCLEESRAHVDRRLRASPRSPRTCSAYLRSAAGHCSRAGPSIKRLPDGQRPARSGEVREAGLW